MASNNEQLRRLQEAEAACEAEAVAAARAVEYRNELRHRLDIQVCVLHVQARQDVACRPGKMLHEHCLQKLT